MINKKIKIKNMVSKSCIKLLEYEFKNSDIEVINIELGFAEISYDSSRISFKEIETILENNGFEHVKNKDEEIVEEIKHAVIELIHHMNNIDSIIRKSEYLVEKLRMSYQQISKIFSKNEPITLEKYIILQKIERIKSLIDDEDFTLSEIAYLMDYSSVQHLSTQFKSITGLTVSEYKNSDKNIRKSIDNTLYQ